MKAEWRLDYEDSPFTRCREGVELPQTTKEAIRRLYPGDEWGDWGGIRMSTDRTVFVLPDSKPVRRTTIQRVLGETDTPIHLLVSYMTIPNGQVKNFLNACRACVNVAGPVRVAVAGSKSMEGGGLWHKYFALWLSMRSNSVVIDFYDPAEKRNEWDLELWGTTISCEWIPEKVTYVGLLQQGYDVIVDDVWTFEEGPGLKLKKEYPEHYSLKGRPDSEGFVPFLHSTETRKFSHQPPVSKLGGCRCMLCRVCKECSTTWDSYVMLRHLCSRLGGDTSCFGVSFAKELELVGVIHKLILSQPVMEIKSDAVLRAIMSISEEIGLTVSDRFAQYNPDGVPTFIPMGRYEKRKIRAEQNYEWLQDKRVLFCGVSSTVLGTTRLNRVKYDGDGECDVVFVNGPDVWTQRLSAPIVYAPMTVNEVHEVFPDWRATGRKVGSYNEFVRVVDEALKPVVLAKPRIEGPVSTTSSKSLFPYIHSDLKPLSYRKQMTVGKPYAVKVYQGQLWTTPFKGGDWSEIIIIQDQEWGLLRNNMHLFPKTYDAFKVAWGWIPWNMSSGEFVDLEKKAGIHDVKVAARMKCLDRTVVTQDEQREIYVVRARTMTFLEYLKCEGDPEFEIVRVHGTKEFKLQWNISFHPGGMLDLQFDLSAEWAEAIFKDDVGEWYKAVKAARLRDQI